jgi:dCTP deaminase
MNLQKNNILGVGNKNLLDDKSILKRIYIDEDLIIQPIIDLRQQIGPASIDLRLGSSFISERITSIIELDPTNKDIQDKLLKVVDKNNINLFDPFVLHPNDFALARTFEYIVMPNSLAARLEGRSSWGRRGLLVHSTAGFIDPGFEGYITFELKNVSRLPIKLHPLLRIAQLSFYELNNNSSIVYGEKSHSKYNKSLDVQYSKIYEDPEWKIINNKEISLNEQSQ